MKTQQNQHRGNSQQNTEDRYTDNIPARFVIAFDNAKADETPFPPPDISSPKSNLANRSFICSISDQIQEHKKFKPSSRMAF